MTSYFWSGFPSLSGRSDVMYGRRHIGGATHPLRHPYRLGLLRYRSAYRPGFLVWFCRQQRLVDLVQSPVAINEPILSTKSLHEKRVSLLLAFCPRRAGEIEISFRLDGDAQLCITTLHSVRMHRKLARPSARGPSGTFQLLEGITTSVHHLLYLFSAHDHHDHRGTRLNSALCSPWRWSYEVICEVGIIRAHHQSGEKIAFNCDYRGGSGSPRLRSLTESVRPSVRSSIRLSILSFRTFAVTLHASTCGKMPRFK